MTASLIIILCMTASQLTQYFRSDRRLAFLLLQVQLTTVCFQIYQFRLTVFSVLKVRRAVSLLSILGPTLPNILTKLAVSNISIIIFLQIPLTVGRLVFSAVLRQMKCWFVRSVIFSFVDFLYQAAVTRPLSNTIENPLQLQAKTPHPHRPWPVKMTA